MSPTACPPIVDSTAAPLPGHYQFSGLMLPILRAHEAAYPLVPKRSGAQRCHEIQQLGGSCWAWLYRDARERVSRQHPRFPLLSCSYFCHFVLCRCRSSSFLAILSLPLHCHYRYTAVAAILSLPSYCRYRLSVITDNVAAFVFRFLYFLRFPPQRLSRRR